MDLFDREATFGDDYLYFYAARFTPEQNAADTDAAAETLGLEPGERVLDAPCGHGRMANLLAERGMEVTGVDATELFLDLARQDAAARGADVDYRLGDLRSLPVDGPFDAAVCWFTSFGYFGDDGNRQVLGEFARVLRRGGRLAIEILHHDGIVRQMTAAPFGIPVQRGDDLMLDVSRFDCVTGRIVTERTVHRDGEVRRSRHTVRLPSIPEFDAWLAEAGFSGRRYLNRAGEPPTIDDTRMVVVAVR